MNFKEAEAELRFFFNTAWAGETAIAWPDTEFEPPSKETWVRFDCRENDGFQAGFGSPNNNRFRHTGIVTIQVFQPSGKASVEARDIATQAIAVFMGQTTANGIMFKNVQARQIGNDGNGYYQINVLAEFFYDEYT
ncbi:MAG: phage tail terminator-like protein [Candidatus Kapaibacterium sp.]